MYRMENSLRQERFRLEKPNPSFSSTLLDEIYRSIDEGDKNCGELKLSKTTMAKKQSKVHVKSKPTVDDDEIWNLREACMIEKWMEKKQPIIHPLKEFYRKSKHDYDPDVMFFSSNSNSSESSSGGLSSSDTESIYGGASRTSCFAPRRPKPIKTTVTASRSEQREIQMFDEYRHNSGKSDNRNHDESLIKSKSRALKIYSNLKKVKQPISPGGKVASFLNSLFAAGNARKSKNSTTNGVSKSGQVSTCSSASSFSRSCLSKNSPSTREKLHNEVKRTVRFYPVSVIVDEDCRPCGHKCLYEQPDSNSLSVTIPKAWKIGRSPSKKAEEEPKPRRIEESAMDFLKEYRQNQNQKKNDLNRYVEYDDEEEEEDDDDAISCSSSDLFELDHLAVMADDRYHHQELPVYETTHVRTNRAIAKGLIT